MKCIVSLEGTFQDVLEKYFLRNLYRKSLNICKDPCRSAVVLRSSGTIFTDPQGKLAHKSVQILKERSTWVSKTHLLAISFVQFSCIDFLGRCSGKPMVESTLTFMFRMIRLRCNYFPRYNQ